MALELPFEVLIKHFTSSYSAARAALEDAWDYFLRRRNWLATQFCQPVYEAVITEAVITGRLSAPGFFSDPLIKKAWLGALWTGDAPNQIDPVKEIEAAKRRVALRISTRSEERARLLGGDLEAIQPQIVKEEKWLRDAGAVCGILGRLQNKTDIVFYPNQEKTLRRKLLGEAARTRRLTLSLYESIKEQLRHD